MATSTKRSAGKRAAHARSPLARLTAAQLLKLRQLASTKPDLTYAVTSDGLLLVAFLPAWLRDGWTRLGDFVAGNADVDAIVHVIPDHGRLVGYCEEKPATDRERALAGTRVDPKPKAARRLTFKPVDAESTGVAIKRARAAAKAA